MNCPKLRGNGTCPQNFCSMKLGEIALFYVVTVIEIYYALACNFTKSDTTALGVCHAV